MKPWPHIRLAFVLALAAIPAFAQAQDNDPQKNSALSGEIAALRKAVIDQTRQIDALTAEVARLGRVVSSSKPAGSATHKPIPAPSPLAEASTPLPADTAPKEAGVADPVESPAAADAGPEYEVQKGDNLTAIAKKHGTTIEVLQKLNHINDPKKLLAGQKLKLPPEAAASPAASSPTPTAQP